MAALFSDSDIVTRRSVSGYILMLGGGPASKQSKRQMSITTSTMVAEYIALFEASKQAIWVNRFLEELKIAVSLAKGTNSTKAKHIDVAYHFTRDCITNGDIEVDYIPSDKMLADIQTKTLS